MITLFFKCLVGAAAVLVIALVSKSKVFFIAGMVPLFPTFALIAHYIVGTTRSAEDLRVTALFGMWSLIRYASYLLSIYVLSTRVGLAATLGLSTMAWLLAAAILLLTWTRCYASPS